MASVKVVFAISGWARVVSPTDEVLLEEGSVLTIPPGVECHGFPAGHSRTVTFYVHPEYLSEQARWMPATHPLAHHLGRSLDGDPTLHTLQLTKSTVQQLVPTLTGLASMSENAINHFKRLSAASEVLNAVGRLGGISSGNLSTNTAPRFEVAAAIALLQANLARLWSMDELAREIAMSPSHLARLFRAQLSISPASFLRQLRADRMAELLATTSITVSEAGAAVGWNDAAVASRSFKQRYGVAPRVYASFHRKVKTGSSILQ